MIEAKAVIPNRFWILKQSDQKIGNIQADNNGYSLSINNQVVHFKTLDLLKKRVPVSFDTGTASKKEAPTDSVHGYPTDGIAHNGIWDVRRHLPLYTKEEKSRSWAAAGWYRIRQHQHWISVFCPKTILLDRYEYQGPFKSEEESRKQ
jgi:hypothetical protein